MPLFCRLSGAAHAPEYVALDDLRGQRLAVVSVASHQFRNYRFARVFMSLADRLRNRILEHGPITFRDFMAEALYSTDGGYYTSGRATIGRGGDFYTSVSVGAVFGRLVARQFIEMWERLGSPAGFTMVEQGAHTGQFAQDVMESLARFAPELLATLNYRIVEPSDALEQAQRERLQKFVTTVCWHKTLPDLPRFEGVHFSNELLDAFPVVRAVWDGATWREQAVAWQDGRFVFVTDRELDQRCRRHISKAPSTLPPGYQIEIGVEAGKWIEMLSAKLVKGWVLAIDYGHPRSLYFRPDRISGTLAAYSEHRRVEDFLQKPGEVDLTAHVDFTTLAELAESVGFELCGYTDQHHLMVGLSRLHFADRSEGLSQEDQKELRGFKTLMHPETMGQSFKAICFGRNVRDSTLSGFSMARDPRAALELA